MDVAVAIFNIGAGLGVLAAGGALAYLAWQTAPLIRDSRALAADLRRLSHAADTELRPLVARATELAGNVEVLSEDAAVRLERLATLVDSLEQAIATGRITVAAGRSGTLPVESWETREDVSG